MTLILEIAAGIVLGVLALCLLGVVLGALFYALSSL